MKRIMESKTKTKYYFFTAIAINAVVMPATAMPPITIVVFLLRANFRK